MKKHSLIKKILIIAIVIVSMLIVVSLLYGWSIIRSLNAVPEMVESEEMFVEVVSSVELHEQAIVRIKKMHQEGASVPSQEQLDTMNSMSGQIVEISDADRQKTLEAMQ